MTEIWLDYSGARPDPHELKKLGVVGVCRYLSEPVSATAWKRITVAEKDALLAAGLDIILNYEWYEGRMLEGAPAGAHDGAVALAQAKALGYPKGASIYFSHDTSARNDAAVLAYMRAAQEALGDYYKADIYSGIDVVDLCINNGVASFGWQTVAWSNGRIGKAHMFQNGSQWFNGGCDENKVLQAGNGSWMSHDGSVTTGGDGGNGGGGHHGDGNTATYIVSAGDTLGAIANRFHTSISQLEAWNPIIKNPNLIQVGWKLKVSEGGPVPTPPPPPPIPHPVPSDKYVVRSGDNLTVIAQRFHTTVAELVKLNPSLRAHPNLIRVGEVLVVPGGAQPSPGPVTHVKQYRVVSGDTLSVIAHRYGTTVQQLMAWNKSLIKNPNLIHVGWVLRVG